jgi:DnaJ-class molecular chaperone
VTDPYRILGVSTSASAAEIRQSFRELALKYHPDRNKNSEESRQKFMQIVEAYRILTDNTASKQQYRDNSPGRPYAYSASGYKWISSNLSEFYDQLKRSQRITTDTRGHTIRYIGKATNALMRKGPMVLISSIATAARSFAINTTPTEEGQSQ